MQSALLNGQRVSSSCLRAICKINFRISNRSITSVQTIAEELAISMKQLMTQLAAVAISTYCPQYRDQGIRIFCRWPRIRISSPRRRPLTRQTTDRWPPIWTSECNFKWIRSITFHWVTITRRRRVYRDQSMHRNRRHRKCSCWALAQPIVVNNCFNNSKMGMEVSRESSSSRVHRIFITKRWWTCRCHRRFRGQMIWVQMAVINPFNKQTLSYKKSSNSNHKMDPFHCIQLKRRLQDQLKFEESKLESQRFTYKIIFRRPPGKRKPSYRRV